MIRTHSRSALVYPGSMKPTLLAFLLVAACGGGSSNSGDDGAGGDDAPPIDAAVDAPPAPPMIKITGAAVSRTATGPVNLQNVVITGYRYSDESTPVAMTTTAADGTFTLDIATGGVALDGYLKATLATYKDTYLYPPAPIAADTIAPINMIAANLLDLVEQLTGEVIDPTKSLIALIVVDGATAQSMPIADAKVTSTPVGTSTHYTNPATKLPGKTETMTYTDGAAFIFNVEPGPVTVGATKAGTTFKSHGLKSHPNALNTTLVTP